MDPSSGPDAIAFFIGMLFAANLKFALSEDFLVIDLETFELTLLSWELRFWTSIVETDCCSRDLMELFSSLSYNIKVL